MSGVGVGLALLWSGLALGAARHHRPLPPARRRTLRDAAIRTRGRRWPRPGPRTCLLVLAVTSLALAAMAPPLVPVLAVLAWAAPRWRARQQRARRLAAVESSLPEVVDLLALAVGAGATVPLAVAGVAHRGRGPVAGELARIHDEVRRGRRLADALDDLAPRTSEAARPLAAALAASERYGAPIGPALTGLAGEVRRGRQRRAEEAARRVPVLLLFPVVFCILPAFALLTVVPLLAGAISELRLPS